MNLYALLLRRPRLETVDGAPVSRNRRNACPIGAAQAQHAPASPYAGWEQRTVKALSDQQIVGLRGGRGMGLALPAELNGYPGPVHVLELGDQLRLIKEQRTRVQQFLDAMEAEAIPLGEHLIAQKTELERQFATPASLQAAMAGIGATQAALGLTHLRYHLSTLSVLTSEPVRRYGELPGYQAAESHGPGSKGHHESTVGARR